MHIVLVMYTSHNVVGYKLPPVVVFCLFIFTKNHKPKTIIFKIKKTNDYQIFIFPLTLSMVFLLLFSYHSVQKPSLLSPYLFFKAAPPRYAS